VSESSHPTLRDQARAAVATAIIVTGRQVPVPLEESAVALLADLWAAGLRYGVRLSDWQATTSPPTAFLDVRTFVR
jgi:hypothetical protein